jgi:hypothetical protein
MATLKSQKVRRTGNRDKLAEHFAFLHLKCLLHDAHQHLPHYRSADLRRDILTLDKRISNEGLPFVTAMLPKIAAGVLALLEGETAVFPSFKMKGVYPCFLSGLAHTVVNDSNGTYERAVALKYLYNVCVAFKKLRGPYKKEQLAEQYSKFCAVDSSLNFEASIEAKLPILENARIFLARILRGLSIEDKNCIPRPGPGATNSPTQPSMRYRPHRRFLQVEEVFPLWESWSFGPWDFVNTDMTEHVRRLLDEPYVRFPTSRFKFVPKTWEKARGICIEENEVQYLQQALRRLIVKRIEKTSLSNHIALNDQSVNAELALKASIDKYYCTIDMSEASDRISRALVFYLFQDNEELCDALDALSTRYIKPPEEADTTELLEAKKFAPMGSALCFPVMSLVHYALIRAIILLSNITDREIYAEQIYVYGDDIIIPTACYTAITSWLPLFGMKLNTDKSFHRSHFRESCGIHAYHGMNITPVFVKQIPNQRKPGRISSCLAVESDLHKNGFERTARFHRRYIRDQYGYMPFVNDCTNVVGFRRSSFTDIFSLRDVVGYKARWNDDYLAYEYRCKVFVTSKTENEPPTQSEALLRWHCQRPSKDGTITQDKGTMLETKWTHTCVDSTGPTSWRWRWLTESEVRGSMISSHLKLS